MHTNMLIYAYGIYEYVDLCIRRIRICCFCIQSYTIVFSRIQSYSVVCACHARQAETNIRRRIRLDERRSGRGVQMCSSSRMCC